MSNPSIAQAKVDLGVAFGRPNLVGKTVPGYTGTDTNPHLPLRNPVYTLPTLLFRILMYAWQREWGRQEYDPRRGVWFGGPKGCGKNEAICQFFGPLGVPVAQITATRGIPLADYLQSFTVIDGTKLSQDGPILAAMLGGYPLVIHEITALDPGDLLMLHDIIDKGEAMLEGNEKVRAKRGFIVCVTDNTMGAGDPTGGYAGTNIMNSALTRRFFKELVDYPSETEEVQLLQLRFPKVDVGHLGRFVKLANMVRAAYKGTTSGKRMTSTLSTAELIDWVEMSIGMAGVRLIEPNFDPERYALDRTAGMSMTAEDLSVLEELYKAVFTVNKKAKAP